MGRSNLATRVAMSALCAAAAGCSDAPTANQAARSVIRTLSAASATSSALSATGSSPVYGIHNDIAMQTHAQRVVSIQQSQSLHAKVVRTSIKMSNVEPTKGVYSWSGTDGTMADVKGTGISVLATLWGSPSWANGSTDMVYVPTDATAFSAWVSAYAAFAGAVATRYKGQINYYELWNEENIQDCWHPAPNVSQYITWYKAVYAAIKAADPNAQVGMGGITNLDAGGSADINGKTYLTDMYKAGVYPDAVVIHAYAPSGNGPSVTLQWQNNFSDIAMIHGIMNTYAQGGKQLWVTEWGWQASQVGEANQATYISQALNLLASTYNYVTLSTLFMQQDQSSYTFGVIRSDGSQRPSAAAFATFAASQTTAPATAPVLATTSATVAAPVYGVHDDIAMQTHTDRVASIAKAQWLHAKIVRTSIKMSNIERSQGSYDWSSTDGALADLKPSGIAVVATLWGSPSWANGSTDMIYVPTNAAAFSSWVSAYATFAGAVAARYKGQIKYYELWNEENILDCWHPNPNVNAYITWYKAVSAAIKQADPSAQVGMGGLTNLAAGGSSDINGKAFLTQMYQAGVYPDAVVLHAYSPSGNGPTTTLQWQNNFSDIAMMHTLMGSYGQGSKPLWVTEWGWRASQVGETNQATYISQALKLLATQYTYVTMSTLFMQQDLSGYTFGLYRGDGSQRPAASIFESFAASH